MPEVELREEQLILSPPELIERLAALVPPPRRHRLRYYGVLAPNVPLRAAVTAMAPERVANTATTSPKDHDEQPEPSSARRSPARYLWAILLARIFEAFPLTCPRCSAGMRIIAFVTDPAAIRAILAHIGAPTHPPRVAPSRDPPAWEADAGESIARHGDATGIDPLAQPGPDYIFDQRIT